MNISTLSILLVNWPCLLRVARRAILYVKRSIEQAQMKGLRIVAKTVRHTVRQPGKCITFLCPPGLL